MELHPSWVVWKSWMLKAEEEEVEVKRKDAGQTLLSLGSEAPRLQKWGDGQAENPSKRLSLSQFGLAFK